MEPIATSPLILSMLSPAVLAEGEERMKIIRNGTQPAVEGSESWFTGKVKIESPFQASEPARVGGATVTFTPCARTVWHTHPLGQTLLVIAGHGLVQEWGKEAKEIKQGDIVWIPEGVKHWHGATPDASMTHIAIAESLNGSVVEWMEAVSDAQYLGDLP